MNQPTLPRPAEEGVTVPIDAAIPCPMQTFRPRKATACPKCPRFEGLLRISEDDAGLPWDRTFRIICAHPISRGVQIISE